MSKKIRVLIFAALVAYAVLALLAVQSVKGTEISYQVKKINAWPTNPDSIINAQTLRVTYTMAEEVYKKTQAVPPDSIFFYLFTGKSDEDSLVLTAYAADPQNASDSVLVCTKYIVVAPNRVYYVPVVLDWTPFQVKFYLSAFVPDAADTNIVKDSGFIFRWYK